MKCKTVEIWYADLTSYEWLILFVKKIQKALQPVVPNDLAISFYIQSHKLICAIYHMQKDQHGQIKFDIFQVVSSNSYAYYHIFFLNTGRNIHSLAQRSFGIVHGGFTILSTVKGQSFSFYSI